jgi:hypothetical protein
LLEEWAYVRTYTSNAQRTRALDRWLHTYNHHRGHTALGGEPPISATNVAGQQLVASMGLSGPSERTHRAATGRSFAPPLGRQKTNHPIG